MAIQEVYDGEKWIAVGTSGTVTAVAVEGGEGLTVTGSPIVESGKIHIELNNRLKEFALNTQLAIPTGDSEERPAEPSLGSIRYNTEEQNLEIWNNTDWQTMQNKLDSSLESIANLSSTGILVKDTDEVYARTITAGDGLIVTDGDGILGNPIVKRQPFVFSGAINGFEDISAGINQTSDSQGIIFGTTVNTTLGTTQQINARDFRLNYSSPSATEYSLTHKLDDTTSSSPAQFVENVEVSGSNGNRGWSVIYQLGSETAAAGNYQINYYHPTRSVETPIKISTVGSTLRTYIDTDLDMENHKIENVATPTADGDVVNKAYVDSFGNLSNKNLQINTDTHSYNWLRAQHAVYNHGYLKYVYRLNTPSQALMIENTYSGRSAGIGFNAYYGNTIWSSGDYDESLLNFQDINSSNNRRAYVSTWGEFVQSSSKTRKHSIRNKKNNNVLDRFLKVAIKSYGYKHDTDQKESEETLNRVAKKTNKMAVGLVLEELFELFPNCLPEYYNALFQDKKKKKRLNIEEELQDVSNSGISYNVLMCYFIMAFQEYVAKTDKEIAALKESLNNR